MTVMIAGRMRVRVHMAVSMAVAVGMRRVVIVMRVRIHRCNIITFQAIGHPFDCWTELLDNPAVSSQHGLLAGARNERQF